MTGTNPHFSKAFDQPDAESLSQEHWDVIVMGGGPAGSTVATLLARQKYRVLIIDRARFPREKVCGDILLPDTMRSLTRLGLHDLITGKAHHLGKIRGVSTAGTSFEVSGEYFSLRRTEFDYLLLQESVAAGAICSFGDGINAGNSGESQAEVTLRSGASLSASIVVIATGADASLAKQSGAAEQCKVNAVALRCYVRSEHLIEEGILCYHRNIVPGYAWIFPLGNGLYNVGCGVTLSDRKQYHLKQMFETFVAEYEPAKKLLEANGTRTHLIGAAIRFGLHHPEQSVNGGIIAIGETIGTTLPFTGEGIGTAMRSAELAADCIHSALRSGTSAALKDFPSKLTEFRPLFDGYTAAQRWLRYPLFNDLAARRIKASSYLQKLCSGVIAGEVSPREIYSVRGILKSLWK
jgi:geranylgeranyl reductase family protein